MGDLALYASSEGLPGIVACSWMTGTHILRENANDHMQPKTGTRNVAIILLVIAMIGLVLLDVTIRNIQSYSTLGLALLALSLFFRSGQKLIENPKIQRNFGILKWLSFVFFIAILTAIVLINFLMNAGILAYLAPISMACLAGGLHLATDFISSVNRAKGSD